MAFERGTDKDIRTAFGRPISTICEVCGDPIAMVNSAVDGYDLLLCGPCLSAEIERERLGLGRSFRLGLSEDQDLPGLPF
jgi:hypothetical protein